MCISSSRSRVNNNFIINLRLFIECSLYGKYCCRYWRLGSERIEENFCFY